jgi:hypothetical protein
MVKIEGCEITHPWPILRFCSRSCQGETNKENESRIPELAVGKQNSDYSTVTLSIRGHECMQLKAE